MVKSLRKYASVLLAMSVAGWVASCGEQGPDNTPGDPLKVSRTSILAGEDPEKISISVTSGTGSWTLTGATEWCKVDPLSGEAGLTVVTVDIVSNTGEEGAEPGTVRETTLEITSGQITRKITVKQLAEKITTPNQNDDYYINRDIYENYLKQWYLYDSELASAAADYNQYSDRFLKNYLVSLGKNDLDRSTWSRNNEPFVYSYMERRPRSQRDIPPLNYGMEFELTTISTGASQNMVGRILYVVPGSPAAAAGLRRGDWFRRINGRTVEDWRYERQIDSLVRPLAGVSVPLGMVSRTPAGYMQDNNRTVNITPAWFKGSPILYSTVIQRPEYGTDRTINAGYIVYNSFDPDYEQELVNVFEGFKKHTVGGVETGINSLILDLRYNNTGSVETAVRLAGLIAPEALRGTVFANYKFNSQQSAHDRTAIFEPDPVAGVGVTRLIVIATGHTAGAAELIINGFNGLEEMEFVMLGGTTEGMSGGMAALRNAIEDDEYVYNVYPMAFGCTNGAGVGNYRGGFSPNGQTVSEWDVDNIVWDSNWGVYQGKSRDALLSRALQYADGTLPIPERAATALTSSAKAGYPRLFCFPTSMTMEVEN